MHPPLPLRPQNKSLIPLPTTCGATLSGSQVPIVAATSSSSPTVCFPLFDPTLLVDVTVEKTIIVAVIAPQTIISSIDVSWIPAANDVEKKKDDLSDGRIWKSNLILDFSFQ
ncbi:unnamed protein product [Linum trigynum]|uniref:Uncharacterized protein n=1 Tax=Linum trigynum TaxID=586398 RepID=A0AAV2EUW8_9ROSI